MLEHLLDPQFDDLADVPASTVFAAQSKTAQWLESVGVKTPPPTDEDKEVGRKAFAALTDPSVKDADKKAALMAMNVPAQVRHVDKMLDGYDWEYIEKAKHIRGYVAAKLMEESTHPDARVRLRALQMLGTLTEVGSFTERIEVTKKDASENELYDRLRSKLTGLLPKTIEVQDVVAKNG